MQRQLIAGWGGVPLVGTPEQIVNRFGELHDIGIDGVALTRVNYREGIDQFNEQVLPLLVEAGFRGAVSAATPHERPPSEGQRISDGWIILQ